MLAWSAAGRYGRNDLSPDSESIKFTQPAPLHRRWVAESDLML